MTLALVVVVLSLRNVHIRNKTMSDCDVEQMENIMAQEPIPCGCSHCGWGGYEHLLKDSNCPKCNSHSIEYNIPEETK